MGTSTNGILAYGYHFGAEGSFELAEVDTYGTLTAPWYDDDARDDDGHDIGLIDQAINALYASIPNAPEARYDWDREDIVEKHLGVRFEAHCSDSHPMWILTTKVITAYRGDAKVVSLPELAQDTGLWGEQLTHALTVLGITPKQDRPEWLLCSYWG